MRYVKKRIPVEAIQTPTHLPTTREYMEWFKAAPKWFHNRNIWMTEEGLVLQTLEGDMLCAWGNWIIHGPHDEIYPIHNDVFLDTYEPWEEE